jgi:tRNA G18 (ribose-2'-O)-methylase SpoU
MSHKTEKRLVCGALLDNIRSTFNVGSIFRTADGVGLQRLYLCGFTATPNNPKIAKTALGAERTLKWSYHKNSLEVVRDLKAEGQQILALEAGYRSKSLFELNWVTENSPIILVVGNEVAGVDPGILELCDWKAHIPMRGNKNSLNVAVAFGIAIYYLHFQGNTSDICRGSDFPVTIAID